MVKNQLRDIFCKALNTLHPADAIQKKLVSDEDFEDEKILRKNKNKRKRKKKKEKKECKHEVAAKDKELKRIKKVEKNKKDMWARLKDLNNNFAKMKEQKKLDKKKKLYFP